MRGASSSAGFSRYVFAIATQAYRLRREDAEEVFQEVFTRTYEHLERLRDDEAIRPWIGQLARRLCIDRLRAGSREELVDLESMPGGSDETMETLDEAFAVHEAMAGLSENCQEILDRFFARDESYQTIGDDARHPVGHDREQDLALPGASLRELMEGRNPGASPSG